MLMKKIIRMEKIMMMGLILIVMIDLTNNKLNYIKEHDNNNEKYLQEVILLFIINYTIYGKVVESNNL